MAEKDKIFYWLKLSVDFMTSDKVDWLMSQKNGANYVVLYQMLVLKTINTKGELGKQIGEILVPFDVQKIQRDCKWFDVDTIIVALELYKKLGLVYMQENGLLQITKFEELVGSETYWAKQKRLERDINKGKYKEIGKSPTNVQNPLISNILISNNLLSTYNFSNNIIESINSWLLYKKEKKQTYKEQGLKALITSIDKKIKQYGEQYVIENINNSMAHNWAGIYYDNNTATSFKGNETKRSLNIV